MNKQFFFLVSLTLIAMAMPFAGCHRGQATAADHQLLSADSIMRADPEKALQLLGQMDEMMLRSESDRAYHALLLTQARYRCYMPATSDSLINQALAYYERHPAEREKLSRAYIYKGAVMEELGHPDEAMVHYKHAMEAIAPDDNFNQGYVRLRLGQIYNDSYVADSIDVEMFKQALHYFEKVPDSVYICACLSQVGNAYMKNNPDSVLPYLERADALAKRLHLADIERTNLRYIADFKMHSNTTRDIEAARDIALLLLDDSICIQDERDHLLMVVAYSLARLNKPESASRYLSGVNASELLPDSRVFFDKCMAEVALSRGDLKQYQHYYERSHDRADSLCTSDLQRQLREVETKYDNETLKYQAERYRSNWLISLLATALILSALVMVIMAVMRKLSRQKQRLAESRDAIERLNNDKAALVSRLNANQAMSEELKQTISNQIDIFSRLIEKHGQWYAASPKKFSEAFEKSCLINESNGTFWSGLRAYADSQCNGIITQTAQSYPSLSETDINFLTLYCCDIPTTVIMACMGYRESHSVYNKKRRIAAAVGCPNQLDEYVERFKPKV